ncbi:hypothetical protein L5515_005860 [Caenorhabditis briggsae]|nr:hypothetical protein B9Z55_016579 [Caenorhabditis nigoni]ULT86062.1 hypothetical protein L3Y34_006029 [Caenorhabditis briggsae]UMM31819.1 hypothetical protein L5515_005860 [Caenorhabditis briggsae]
MNELLAIIAIVIVCCVMFFLWLLSMALCPDAMVNATSGRKDKYCESRDSKELIQRCEEGDIRHVSQSDFIKNVVSAEKMPQPLSTRRSSDKKLSVVPEADEQSTVQSTIHSIRPTILRRQPSVPVKLEEEVTETSVENA